MGTKATDASPARRRRSSAWQARCASQRCQGSTHIATLTAYDDSGNPTWIYGSAGGTGSTATGDNWITSERPYVKFLAPPGWNKNIKGDWGVFKSPDGAAVFAFTTFNQPGESTTRLVGAASVPLLPPAA